MCKIPNILLLAATMFLLAACDNSTEPEWPADCPELQLGTGSSHGFKQGAVSSDGKILAMQGTFGRIFLLNLETGTQTELKLHGLSPNVSFIHFGRGVSWCPYDPHKLLVVAYTHTDTSGSGKYVGAENAYIVAISGQVISRVTPNKYPSWGSTSGGLASPYWLQGSTVTLDSIHLTSGIYIPQQERLISTPFEIIAQSRDASHWFGMEIASQTMLIDGMPFTLNGYPPPGPWFEASFSASGKYLALSGWRSSETPDINTPNVWIIDMERFAMDPTQPLYTVSVINTQRDYCMFTFASDPVFITDSTLAIPMFKAGGSNGGYHEIHIDGRYIRKLSKAY